MGQLALYLNTSEKMLENHYICVPRLREDLNFLISVGKQLYESSRASSLEQLATNPENSFLALSPEVFQHASGDNKIQSLGTKDCLDEVLDKRRCREMLWWYQIRLKSTLY